MESFDKNSADKVQSKKVKGIKVPSFIPIRVKTLGQLGWSNFCLKKEDNSEFVLILKKNQMRTLLNKNWTKHQEGCYFMSVILSQGT